MEGPSAKFRDPDPPAFAPALEQRLEWVLQGHFIASAKHFAQSTVGYTLLGDLTDSAAPATEEPSRYRAVGTAIGDPRSGRSPTCRPDPRPSRAARRCRPRRPTDGIRRASCTPSC